MRKSSANSNEGSRPEGVFHQLIRRHFKVERSRVGDILRDISNGSTPAPGYYTLIAAAALIASLGLIANSTAVVIGAMLVSPLMTPIFGIALGMIRGNAVLLGKAVRAEVGGVILAVAFGALLGTLPISTEITPEMLSRTAPTLLDLLVAVFAGFAGALALTNERISPALPGVAISTAIVPPLATSGLCMAYGSYGGAYGAFLLFTANFFAILLVSTFVFAIAGLGSQAESMPLNKLTRRLTVMGACFVLVALILTKALIGVVEARRCEKLVRGVLTESLGRDQTTSLVDVMQNKRDERLDVLATIRTPKVFTPDRVKSMEEKLESAVGAPLTLIVRCVLSRDVAPTGSIGTVVSPTLDGDFIKEQTDPDIRRIQLAEQTLREMLAKQPQLTLQDTDLLYLGGDTVILATVQTPRLLLPMEVAQYEAAIGRRLGESGVRLLLRCLVTTDVTSRGRILYGAAHFGEAREAALRAEEETRKAVEATGEFFAPNVDALWEGEGWRVRAEITGPRTVSQDDISRFERTAESRLGQSVTLTAWSRIELMVTGKSITSVEEYTAERLRRSETAEDPTRIPKAD